MAELPPDVTTEDDIATSVKKFGGNVHNLTMTELELELEILKTAISIFDDAKLDPRLWDDAAGTYRQRIRDLENEIFERGVLV